MQPRRNVPKPQVSYRFDELAVLVAVAEAGSLSAAAKQKEKLMVTDRGTT